MRLLAWSVLATFALSGAEAQIPKPVLPEGVGVNIHFITGQQKDLDLIAGAGFKFVRMDFAWEATEKNKAEYDWSSYEELLANLEQRGLRAILIFDYSHRLYEETVISPNPITGHKQENVASPRHPESIAAFARWAGAAAAHFRGHHVLWEIWNEPNGNFWSPKPDVEQYSSLALATARAVRAADPQATIIGPASSGFPWTFLEAFLKSGALDYLDAVSVHPYRNPRKPPETAAEDYRRLRGLINQYASSTKRGKIPILSGEWGYSSWKRGVTLETQAAFAVRQQLCNLLEGVPLSIWYDWKNDGSDPNENEHNFGTVLPELEPKPTYDAIKTMTTELKSYRILQRLATANDQDFLLLCGGSGRSKKLVAWTVGEAHSVTVPLRLLGRNRLTAVLGNGAGLTPKIQSGSLVLELGPLPQYVTLLGAAIK
jgi:hypothetical protein